LPNEKYLLFFRELVGVDKIRKVLMARSTEPPSGCAASFGGQVTDYDFAWKERHADRNSVGGMGDDAVFLEMPRQAVFPPGALRAAVRLKRCQALTRKQMDDWTRERGVALIGADLDESPMAYRRVPEVSLPTLAP
jgi:hypothetical protein